MHQASWFLVWFILRRAFLLPWLRNFSFFNGPTLPQAYNTSSDFPGYQVHVDKNYSTAAMISWHWVRVSQGGCRAVPGLITDSLDSLYSGETSWDRWAAGPGRTRRQSSVSPGAESRPEPGPETDQHYSISIRLIIFRHSQWYKPAVRPFLKPLWRQKITKKQQKSVTGTMGEIRYSVVSS